MIDMKAFALCAVVLLSGCNSDPPAPPPVPKPAPALIIPTAGMSGELVSTVGKIRELSFTVRIPAGLVAEEFSTKTGMRWNYQAADPKAPVQLLAISVGDQWSFRRPSTRR